MAAASDDGKVRNQRLIAARERLVSPSGSGLPMSTQEVAEGMNAYLWQKHLATTGSPRPTELDHRFVSTYEAGRSSWPSAHYREAWRFVLKVATDAELGFRPKRRRSASAAVSRPSGLSGAALGHEQSTAGTMRPDTESDSGLHGVERLRQGLMNTLRHGTVSGTSLDDWEMTVIRHGRATRDRPAGVLLGDLHSDLVELDQAISRHPPASSLRRLTRATAHMSGLMCLTLCKLDQRSAFRRWARTARLAANEAGDPETFSWVLAQEAYGHFYSGDFSEAIDVARQAQDVSRSTPCVGTALAAALEARAYAVTNRPKETRVALGQAESNLSNLSGTALEASAFGYNEAQLRFHEGNAYTHLGDMASALPAQERALILCAEGDYTDWSLTRLDRTKCLAKTGNTFDAMAYGSETLLSLSEDRRGGIIALRGLEVFNSLSDEQKLSKSASDFRDILMHTANAERY